MILNRNVSKIFFGRDNLLEVLYRTVMNAKDGGAESILISGRRGIGKTALLANLYDIVFQRQDGTIPFLYTPGSSLVTAEDFSRDYLGSFILQGLAFQGKDPSVLAGSYSLEDLKDGAKNFGAQWAVDIINDHLRTRAGGERAKIVRNALSAPYRSYQMTGAPVVVMIDDVQRIRRFCEFNSNEINSNFWTPFEDSVRSLHVPHIFSDVPHVIEKVLFQETLSGDSLEMIDLPGLDREDSIKLFTELCKVYGLKAEMEPADIAGRFSGNPFYIKNFLQASRHTGGVLSKDLFRRTYYNEISGGKTYKYWTFILKAYVRQLDLRRPSLGFLYGLCGDDKKPPQELLPAQDVLERITGLLHDSGCIETGFSETRLADEVLRDIVTVLYLREIQNESQGRIGELLTGKEGGQVRKNGAASFVITIPADRKAGLVAIKSFEQVARNYNIPLKAMEKLQLAMADLFSNFFSAGGVGESFKLQVKCGEKSFFVEISAPQKDLVLSDMDSKRIRAYVDDLKIESTADGTLITLIKEIREDFVPPSDD